jgi:hypothetical protein
MMSNPKAFPRVWVCLLAGLLLLSGVSGAEPVPADVAAAAEAGLERFLPSIPAGEEEFFAFADRDEISRATLGEPFRIFTLHPQDVIEFAEGRAGEPPIRETQLYQFPVMCDGTARTLLTVDWHQGQWRGVDLGGRSPGPELIELRAEYPPEEGYELTYVYVFQIGSQFVRLSRGDLVYFLPIEGSARALGLVEEAESYEFALMELAEVAHTMAPHLRAALQLDD